MDYELQVKKCQKLLLEYQESIKDAQYYIDLHKEEIDKSLNDFYELFTGCDEIVIHNLMDEINKNVFMQLFISILRDYFDQIKIFEINETENAEIMAGGGKNEVISLFILMVLLAIFSGVDSILVKIPLLSKFKLPPLNSALVKLTKSLKTKQMTPPDNYVTISKITDSITEGITDQTDNLNKLFDSIVSTLKSAKESKTDKLIKTIFAVNTLITEITDVKFKNIKNLLLPAIEVGAFGIYDDKKLVDKISLLLKIVDTLYNGFVFYTNISNKGLMSQTIIEDIFSFVKILIALGQIILKTNKIDNPELVKSLDQASNIYIFKDMASNVSILSSLPFAYLFLMLLSWVTGSKIKGGKTKRKKRRKRKTKKINQQKKLKYNVRLK